MYTIILCACSGWIAGSIEKDIFSSYHSFITYLCCLVPALIIGNFLDNVK